MKAYFEVGSKGFTAEIAGAEIMIACNDNPAAKFDVWTYEVQKAALVALTNSISPSEFQVVYF